MLKYLIIPLHDNAVSYCHYPARETEGGAWIEPKLLSQAIRYAMLENLTVQFVYPREAVPAELSEVIETIDHGDIVPSDHQDAALRDSADITVFDSIAELAGYPLGKGCAYVLRIPLKEWMEGHAAIADILKRVDRLNVVLTDVEGRTDAELEAYGRSLESLIPAVVEEYKKGHYVQLNLLTDRMMLEKMNNCEAGNESLTLAPDGCFYVCPAFRGDGADSVGTLETGPEIRNPRLYRLDHAPICRVCDAYQCRRCVWLNRRLTLEVNTPGHEQCVMSHREREASRKLLGELRKLNPGILPQADIPELGYLDPFVKAKMN